MGYFHTGLISRKVGFNCASVIIIVADVTLLIVNTVVKNQTFFTYLHFYSCYFKLNETTFIDL